MSERNELERLQHDIERHVAIAAEQATELARLQAEVERLTDVLRRGGFVECDIPACNCGGWHHRYGLPERWAEITQALIDADVLGNSTGNKPLNAIKRLADERDALLARVEAAEKDAGRYREALASARVFVQDCIDNGFFERASLANLYGARDAIDAAMEGGK